MAQFVPDCKINESLVVDELRISDTEGISLLHQEARNPWLCWSPRPHFNLFFPCQFDGSNRKCLTSFDEFLSAARNLEPSNFRHHFLFFLARASAMFSKAFRSSSVSCSAWRNTFPNAGPLIVGSSTRPKRKSVVTLSASASRFKLS